MLFLLFTCAGFSYYLLVQDLVERDTTIVNSIIHHYKIPIAILLGGGYHVRKLFYHYVHVDM